MLELASSDPGPHLEQLHGALKDCLAAAGLHTSPAPPVAMHQHAGLGPPPYRASLATTAGSGTNTGGSGAEDVSPVPVPPVGSLGQA